VTALSSAECGSRRPSQQIWPVDMRCGHHLSEYCKSTTDNTGRSHLRSANTRLLSVPQASVICQHSIKLRRPYSWV